MRILIYLNLPRFVCNHLIGERHTTVHRMVAGLGVMTVGVLIAHTASELPHYVAFFADEFGYAVHGLGLTPFVESMAAAATRTNKSPME